MINKIRIWLSSNIDVVRSLLLALAGFSYLCIPYPMIKGSFPMLAYFIIGLLDLPTHDMPFYGYNGYLNMVLNFIMGLAVFSLIIEGIFHFMPRMLVIICEIILFASLLTPVFWNEWTSTFSMVGMLPFVVLNSFALYVTATARFKFKHANRLV